LSLTAFLLIFGAFAAFYALTFDFRGVTDTHLNSLQTRSLVLHGDADLTRYGPDFEGYVVHTAGRTQSIYGIGISLTAAPFYVVMTRLHVSDAAMQGAVAVTVVALASALMFRLLLKIVPLPVAVGGAVVFAFGTTIWPIAAMGLFLHGPVALLQILGLTGFFSQRSRGPALAGLGFAAATFVRPTAAIPLVLVGLFYLALERRSLLLYVGGAVLPLAALVVQNRWMWGSWVNGGYSRVGPGFNADMSHTLFALTFGWWRGIFVYSPVLILGVVGFVAALRWRKGDIERRLIFLGASCIASLLLYARWSAWAGGQNQFGYRLMLDAVPILVVLGAWACARFDRLRIVALGLGALSILTMAFGTASNRFGWDFVVSPRTFPAAPIGQAWIVFVHEPWGSIARVVGIAVVTVIITLVASREVRTRPSLPYAD